MEFKHNESKQQFTLETDGYIAHIDYEPQGSMINILHTIVPDPISGRGIAGQLTKFALETARRKQWKVIPSCTYTAAYLKRHPEFNDLHA